MLWVFHIFNFHFHIVTEHIVVHAYCATWLISKAISYDDARRKCIINVNTCWVPRAKKSWAFMRFSKKLPPFFLWISYLIHMLVWWILTSLFYFHSSLPAFFDNKFVNLHILLVSWHEEGVNLWPYFQYFPNQILLSYLNFDSNMNHYNLATSKETKSL
jgi:hypothetical protein